MRDPVSARQSNKRGLALRVIGSVGIMALLVWIVRGDGTLEKLKAIQPSYLLAAIGAIGAVVGCNTLRWYVLLRGYRVECSLWKAFKLYWISLFFTLFLPGSAGGDVVRSYYVARDQGRLAVILLATFQERLAGLGSLLLAGGIALAFLREQLGTQLTATLAFVHIGTLAVVIIALYPRPLISLAQYMWQRLSQWRFASRLAQHKLIERVQRFIAPAVQPVHLSANQLGALALAMCGSAVFGIGMYWLLSLALNIHVSLFALCLAASVVTLVRTLPISLNGIGVGEGAFVVMLQPFGVSRADAFALSLAGLAVHTIAGLIGGGFYLFQVNKSAVHLTQETPQ